MKISSSGIAGGIVTGLLLAALVIAVRLLWESVREPEPPSLNLDGNGSSQTAPAVIGHVVAIVAPATATTPSGITRTLILKAPIFPNDKIKTAQGARLQILFADNSIVAQGENSEMIIDAYLYQPGDKKSLCSLRFVSGLFRTITGNITDLNPERFKVETRLATIGIRGCELAFRLEPGSETVYILELPDNRSIHIESHTPLPSGALSLTEALQVLEIRDQGTVIEISDSGLMSTHRISIEEARQIISETTPFPPVFQKGEGHRPLSDPNLPGDSAPFDKPETPPTVPTEGERQDHAADRAWQVPYGENLKLEYFSFQSLRSESPSAEFPIAQYAPYFHQMPTYVVRSPDGGILPDPVLQVLDHQSPEHPGPSAPQPPPPPTPPPTPPSGGGGGGGGGEPPIFPPISESGI
jgi:hypothetical protein